MSRILKVCHVVSGDLWAGAEVMDYNLLKGLRKYEHLELSAMLLNDGKLAGEIRKLGIPVSVVDEDRMNFVRIVGAARQVIRRTSPDIIHSHRQKENILSYWSAKNAGWKVHLVATQHGMPEPLRKPYKIVKDSLLSRYHRHILSTRFRYVVAVSEDVRSGFHRLYGIPKEKIRVIHNGTDMSRVRPPVGGKSDAKYVIGSAGRFFSVKDYPFMVKIAREVLKETEEVRFELAGEGPEKETILGLIREYRIEKGFLLRGFMDDMTDFYRGLDLYVNTSFHEGLPMSVLEAMAHGLPVIAPKTGGLTEILGDGMEGYLVEERDPGRFSEKCLRLFRDRELGRRMGAASRKKIEGEFSSDRMAERYLDLYRRIQSEG